MASVARSPWIGWSGGKNDGDPSLMVRKRSIQMLHLTESVAARRGDGLSIGNWRCSVAESGGTGRGALLETIAVINLGRGQDSAPTSRRGV